MKYIHDSYFIELFLEYSLAIYPPLNLYEPKKQPFFRSHFLYDLIFRFPWPIRLQFSFWSFFFIKHSECKAEEVNWANTWSEK